MTTRCGGGRILLPLDVVVVKGVIIQTFLPYANPVKSAEALDYRRLGKQRVETYQILRTLTGQSSGWQNHPAVKMWRGHEIALADYGIAMCQEWIARGYKDTCLEKISEIKRELESRGESRELPGWYGREELHISHQSNLIRKMPEYYANVFVGVPDDLEYYWPA